MDLTQLQDLVPAADRDRAMTHSRNCLIYRLRLFCDAEVRVLVSLDTGTEFQDASNAESMHVISREGKNRGQGTFFTVEEESTSSDNQSSFHSDHNGESSSNEEISPS